MNADINDFNDIKLEKSYTLTKGVNYDTLLITTVHEKLRENAGKKNTHEQKLLESLRRAKRNIKDIIENNINGQSQMITLTYADNMQDYDKSTIDFKKFIRSLNNPKYLQVRELQKRGAIHFHVILFDYREHKTITKKWTHGFSYIKDIEVIETGALSNYLGKYLTDYKKGQTIEVNKRLYNCSRDCKRTKKINVDFNKSLELVEKSVLSIATDNYIKYIIKKEK